jgi:hypothetical protein
MDGVVVGEASRDVRNWLPCSGCGGRGERAGARWCLGCGRLECPRCEQLPCTVCGREILDA